MCRKFPRFAAAGFVLITVANTAAAETRQALLSVAWQQYAAGDDEGAIKTTSACLFEALDDARLMQSELDSAKTEEPAIGGIDPASPAARKIFDRGVLNDAAACAIVQAKSQSRLGHCQAAAAAYGTAQTLSYARVWDGSQSIFWSPARAAKAWLLGHPNGSVSCSN